MADLRHTSCCGVKDYHGLMQTPTATLKYVGSQIYSWGQGCAFVMFTDTGMASRAEEIKRYIAQYNLGKVTVSHTERNPNSGNRLTVYIWAINQEAFANWYATEGWAKLPPLSRVERISKFVRTHVTKAYDRLHPVLRRQGV